MIIKKGFLENRRRTRRVQLRINAVENQCTLLDQMSSQLYASYGNEIIISSLSMQMNFEFNFDTERNGEDILIIYIYIEIVRKSFHNE